MGLPTAIMRLVHPPVDSKGDGPYRGDEVVCEKNVREIGRLTGILLSTYEKSKGK